MEIYESINELLAIANPLNGQTVYVKSYYSGQNKGGGHFTYDTTKSTQNDSGTIFNGWVRQTDFGELYLSWFGAKFDGSDDAAAYQAAINASDNETTIFADGDFTFSTVDYGTKAVSLRGVPSIAAQTLKTTIRISGAGIKCNTQKVKLAYIDFQSTGTKTDNLNICLLTNSKNNGAWVHVLNCRASGFSGHLIFAKDLIDSKISGFIPNGNNIVFKFVRDAWVNNTTIQLEKVYAQNNTLLFDADYCTQSSMIDCIFEFNTSMGHINNGVWTIVNLYTENNSAPLTATNTRLLRMYHFAFTANDTINVTQPDLAYIDKGTSLFTPRVAGVFELQKEFERYKRITPSFSGSTWTKLGTAAIGEAGILCLEILGTNSYTQGNPSASSALGKTIVFAQCKNNSNATFANIQATWHHLGNGAGIQEVRFVQTSTNRYVYDVYVLQSANAYISCAAEISGGDAFVWDIQRLVAKPTGGGTGEENTSTMLIAYPYVKLQAGSGYIGVDESGNPMLGGVSSTSANAGSANPLPSQPTGYLSININGTVRKVPYY
ncbi:hypothetical protein ACT4ZA_11200 [Acinetobacter baumannii]